MLRWLVLAAAVFAAIWLLRRSFGRPDREQPRDPAAGNPARLVNCANCGVHLPPSEALEDAGKFYCSDQHRRLGPAR